MANRQLRLGAFMRPVGIHTGWWRYPGARISTSST
jgi:alkanesulfonate monooxygenase